MNNQDVAHKFFYQTGEIFDKRYMSVNFNDDTFYSYYTAIGKKIVGKNGDDILLISDNNFSNTTCKHINYLMQACPFGCKNIIRIPQRYGSHYLNLNTILKDIEENLKYYSNQKMSLKANRESYSKYFEMLIKLNEKVIDVNQKIIDEYKPLYEIINDPEKLAQEKAKQRLKDKEKQAKLKSELKNYIENYNYIELIKLAFSGLYEIDSEIRSKLKNYLNPKNELSFIWFDGDLCKTSQGIRIDREKVEKMLKLWDKNELKHGMQIDYYTILSITDKFVKVGCHVIPVENLNALLK